LSNFFLAVECTAVWSLLLHGMCAVHGGSEPWWAKSQRQMSNMSWNNTRRWYIICKSELQSVWSAEGWNCYNCAGFSFHQSGGSRTSLVGPQGRRTWCQSTCFLYGMFLPVCHVGVIINRVLRKNWWDFHFSCSGRKSWMFLLMHWQKTMFHFPDCNLVSNIRKYYRISR